MKNRFSVLIISGPVGVGKSRVADAMSEILSSKNISHAVVDMDYLRHVYPRPNKDPFHEKVGYKNLSDVWRNYKDLRTDRLIIVTVVEDKKSLDKYKASVPGSDLIVVRLRAGIGTIEKNLKDREMGNSLKWHLSRVRELTDKLEKAKVEDFVVDIDNKPIKEIGEEILSKINFTK